jgi:hypothetical protein
VKLELAVAILVAGRDIRILDDTGQLTLDPNRDYQPQS